MCYNIHVWHIAPPYPQKHTHNIIMLTHSPADPIYYGKILVMSASGPNCRTPFIYPFIVCKMQTNAMCKTSERCLGDSAEGLVVYSTRTTYVWSPVYRKKKSLRVHILKHTQITNATLTTINRPLQQRVYSASIVLPSSTTTTITLPPPPAQAYRGIGAVLRNSVQLRSNGMTAGSW